MKASDLSRLLKKYKKQFISILISNKEIEKKDSLKLSNLIDSMGWQKEGQEFSSFVTQFRKTFPPNFRDSEKDLKERLDKFKLKYPNISEAEIIHAAETWNREKTPPYCGQSKYFLFKKEKGEPEFSRCANIVKSFKEQKHDRSDYGEEFL